MNSLFVMFGIESWKPVLSALLLPPIPLLLAILVGARLMSSRRGLGGFLVVTSVALLWLTACSGAAHGVSQLFLHPPAALTERRIAELRAEARNRQPAAIVVLGGGVEAVAPEYGVANLEWRSLERLRYGMWLGRQTGLPVGFSGGSGWSQTGSAAEARVAARIAAEEYGRPLKWVEDTSRDTRENAGRSVAMLRTSGITHIVVVTHGNHMPRAMRAFREAAGTSMTIEAAPMGLAERTDHPFLAWIPSGGGLTRMRDVLHEIAGRVAGA